MAAWVIGAIQSVKDEAGFGAYQQAAGPTVAKYGGKLVAGGNKVEVGDGNWSPAGVVVLEFESMAKAKEWYNSSEYQAVVGQRISTTDSGLIFVEAGSLN